MTTNTGGPWITRNMGMLLLGIWLILYGAFYFAHFESGGVLLAILAIVAGIFILMGR